MPNRDAKNQIVKTFISLQRKKPIDKITVKELVSAAGVNRSTFYYHFGRIESILDYMVESFLENVRETTTFDRGYRIEMDGNPADAVAVTNFFYSFIYENRDMFCAIVDSPRRGRFYDELIDTFVEQHRRYPHWWLQEGELVPMRMRDRGYWDRCYSYLMIGAAEQWRLRDFEETPEELSRLIWHLFTNVRGFELRVG